MAQRSGAYTRQPDTTIMTIGDPLIHVTVEYPLEQYCVGLLRSATEELALRHPEEETHELLPDRINALGGVFVVVWVGETPAGCGLKPAFDNLKRYGYMNKPVISGLPVMANSLTIHSVFAMRNSYPEVLCGVS